MNPSRASSQKIAQFLRTAPALLLVLAFCGVSQSEAQVFPTGNLPLANNRYVTAPAQPVSGQPTPIQPVPSQAMPLQTVPVQTVPVQTAAAQPATVYAAPDPRVAMQPVPVQSVVIQPVPVQAAPTQVMPTQAVPVYPAPGQPAQFQNAAVPSPTVQLAPVRLGPVQPEPRVSLSPLPTPLPSTTASAAPAVYQGQPLNYFENPVRPVSAQDTAAGNVAPPAGNAGAPMSSTRAAPSTSDPAASNLAPPQLGNDPLDTPDPTGGSDTPGFGDLMQRLEKAETDLKSLQTEQKAPKTIADRIQALEKGFKEQQEKMPIIRLSGFFQLDLGQFSQDANSMATLGDIQNGVDFRRARLQAVGNVTEMTRYSIEFDFSQPGRPSFFDIWGEQTHVPFFSNVRLGQFRQPITMDGWTSVRHLEFMERSIVFNALDPFRRVGAMAWRQSEDEDTLLAYSIYGTGTTFWNGAGTTYNTMGGDDRFGTQIGDSGGVSFAIRGTHLLYYDEPAEGRYLLHVGGGYNFSQIGGNGFTQSPGATAYQARAIPEIFIGDSTAGGLTAGGTPFVVDTGRFFATSYNLYHAEFAGNYGPAHFQSEVLGTAVNQLNGPVVFYGGAYLQAGYFLTGESVGYNKTLGVLDYNVTPFSNFFGLGPTKGICGWGAWEVAARWSYLDLSATNILPSNYVATLPTVPPSVNPGAVNQSTVALNWWWNKNTRVQFNWIHSMLDNNMRGRSDMDVFAGRFQIEF